MFSLCRWFNLVIRILNQPTKLKCVLHYSFCVGIFIKLGYCVVFSVWFFGDFMSFWSIWFIGGHFWEEKPSKLLFLVNGAEELGIGITNNGWNIAILIVHECQLYQFLEFIFSFRYFFSSHKLVIAIHLSPITVVKRFLFM